MAVSTGECCPVRWWCTADGWVSLPVGEKPASWISGPYPENWKDRVSCTDSGSDSGSSGDPGEPVVTDCGTVSTNLKVTYGALEFTISYDTMTGRWYGYAGDTFDCVNGFGVTLECVGTDWTINAVASFTGHPGGVIVPTSLSPFLFMYSGPSVSGGGGPECGDIDFMITEV